MIGKFISLKTVPLFQKKPYFIFVLLLAIGLGISYIPLKRHTNKLVHETALSNAQLINLALKEFRTVYTSEVIEKLNNKGFNVSHKFLADSNSVPLPATMSMYLGEKIGESSFGASAALYSPFPFPWRLKEGLNDDFREKAWNSILKNRNEPYYEFRKEKGKDILRYATADILRPSCVNCHNTHPDTPKNDWKMGDVRGVLEVKIPLTSIVEQANNGITLTMIVIGILTSILLIILFIIIKKLVFANQLNEDFQKERELGYQKMLDVVKSERKQISSTLHDNIGQIISSARLGVQRIKVSNLPKNETEEIHENVLQNLEDAYAGIRNLAYSVEPEKLLKLGLKSGMKEMILKIQTLSGIDITHYFNFTEEEITSHLKTNIFLITSELLNNALKHSKCTEINIQIIEHSDTLSLTIEDNGIGFDSNEKNDFSGIQTIEARIEWLKGEFAIESSKGKGTSIIIEFPLKN